MYFNAIPNFLYPDFKEPGKYKLSKNLFRRVRTRDSFNAIYASSIPYTIQPRETPDTVAYNQLGSGDWWWTIMILNNIFDYESQWPLEDYELDEILENKYGDRLDKVRHWETSEVKDEVTNYVYLEKGVVVEMYTGNPKQDEKSYIPQIRNPAGGVVSQVNLLYTGKNYTSQSVFKTKNLTSSGEGLTLNCTVGAGGNISAVTGIVDSGKGYVVGDILEIESGVAQFNARIKISSASSLEENWSYTYKLSGGKDQSTYGGSPPQERTVSYTNLLKVTNKEHEYNLNQLKREIFLPRTQYLETMRVELESLLEYDTKYNITKEGFRRSETL